VIVVVQPQRFGPPAVRSLSRRCHRCTAEVWLSARAELTADDVIVCVVCAMAIVKVGDAIELAPWTRADLEELEP
jgi:hypothetical protein